jgi:hypothetical protein
MNTVLVGLLAAEHIAIRPFGGKNGLLGISCAIWQDRVYGRIVDYLCIRFDDVRLFDV